MLLSLGLTLLFFFFCDVCRQVVIVCEGVGVRCTYTFDTSRLIRLFFFVCSVFVYAGCVEIRELKAKKESNIVADID